MEPTKRTPPNAHILGLGLDNEDGHKRVTRADQFSIVGGSEETHARMTETLIKTVEDLDRKGKRVGEASSKEIVDLIQKNTPNK